MIVRRKRLPMFLASAFVAACNPPSQTDQPASGEPTPGAELPGLPVAEPPLDRRALIMLIHDAASASASGRPAAEAQRGLSGKRFEIRHRFGCPGDTAESRTWTFEPETRALRFRIEPEVTSSTALISQLGLDRADGVLGFWIERPWLLDPSCPRPNRAVPASGDEPASRSEEPRTGAPQFAIAQLFSEQDARTHLGGDRPFSTTVRLAEGEAPSTAGYDLVVSGRLERFRDDRVVLCEQAHRDAPPACVVSAQFDRIAISKPGGDVLAEWTAN